MTLKKRIVICVLGMFLSLENIILAIYTSSAINILTSETIDDLLFVSLFTLISLIILFVIKVLFQKIKNEEIGKVNVKARKDLMETHLVNSNKKLTMNMLSNDIKFLEENYYTKKINQYLEVSSFLLSLFTSLWLGWQATIIIVALSLLSVFVPKLFQNKLNQKTNDWSKENDKYLNIVKDILNGDKVIQNYLVSDYFNEKHKAAVKGLERRNITLKIFQKVVEFITYSCSHFAILSMILVSGWLVVNEKMEIGNIIGIIQLSNSITFPIVSFVQNRNMIQSSKDILEKQKNFITRKQEHEHIEEIIDRIEVVQLVDLNYKIDESYILKNVNITINADEKILIVGSSGSGKSTLLSILNGDNLGNIEGEITINNKKTNPNILKKYTSRIMQDYYIFEDTLKNNICFGKLYSEDNFKKAIRLAQLSELFKNKDLNYKLEENGKNISGGQRQRIEIARSLIRNKPILLIDEGLSSLDNNTAELIEREILNIENITVVHITHYVNDKFINEYDKIITVKGGEITEFNAKGVI